MTVFDIFIYFSPKIAENFFCQNPFPAISRRTTKKVPMATKPKGGGVKALVAGPLRKELFLRLP